MKKRLERLEIGQPKTGTGIAIYETGKSRAVCGTLRTSQEDYDNLVSLVRAYNMHPKLVTALKDMLIYCRANRTSQLEPLIYNADLVLARAR